MATSVVIDRLPAKVAPAPVGPARAGERGREEAPARSFEDVLRELDRAGRPGIAEPPAGAQGEGTPEPDAGPCPREDAGDEEAPPFAPAEAGMPGAGRPAGGTAGHLAHPAAAGEEAARVAVMGLGPGTGGEQAVGLESRPAAGGSAPVPQAPDAVPAAPSPAPGGQAAGAELGAPAAPVPKGGSLPGGGFPEGVVPGVPGNGLPVSLEAAGGRAPMGGGGLPEPDRASALGEPVAATEAPALAEGAAEPALQALIGREGRVVGRGDGPAERGMPSSAAAPGPTGARSPVPTPSMGTPGSQGAAPTGEGRSGTQPGVPLEHLLREAGLAGVEDGARLPAEGPAAAGEREAAPAAPSTLGPVNDAQARPPAQPHALSEAPARGEVPMEGEAAPGQGVQAPPVVSPTETPAPQPAVAAGMAREGGPPASLPMGQVGDVVVKRLQQLRNPGSDELRLELEPKELGALKIRLEVRGDGVKAHFVVDRPVVQAMLEQAMAELRQNLAQQGYRVDELRVALQSEGQTGERQGEPEGRDGRDRGRRMGGGVSLRRDVEPIQWGSRIGSGRIDIRV